MRIGLIPIEKRCSVYLIVKREVPERLVKRIEIQEVV